MDHIIMMEPSDEHEAPAEFVTIESCHSTWTFDIRNHRFRRILRGFEGAVDPPTTEWRPYHGVEEYPGTDSFVVWLNPEGTRLLRSWRHRPHCAACADRRTAPVPVAGNAPADAHARQPDGREPLGIE